MPAMLVGPYGHAAGWLDGRIGDDSLRSNPGAADADG